MAVAAFIVDSSFIHNHSTLKVTDTHPIRTHPTPTRANETRYGARPCRPSYQWTMEPEADMLPIHCYTTIASVQITTCRLEEILGQLNSRILNFNVICFRLRQDSMHYYPCMKGAKGSSLSRNELVVLAVLCYQCLNKWKFCLLIVVEFYAPASEPRELPLAIILARTYCSILN